MWASGQDAFWMAPWSGVPATSHWVRRCPEEDPGQHKRLSLVLAWEGLGIPPEELAQVAGEREVWVSLFKLLPPQTNRRSTVEGGWMDGEKESLSSLSSDKEPAIWKTPLFTIHQQS